MKNSMYSEMMPKERKIVYKASLMFFFVFESDFSKFLMKF